MLQNAPKFALVHCRDRLASHEVLADQKVVGWATHFQVGRFQGVGERSQSFDRLIVGDPNPLSIVSVHAAEYVAGAVSFG